MDVDRMRQQETRVCYRCKVKGHLAANCPVKQISELKQDQINSILEAHFANSSSPPELAPAQGSTSSSRPPVTVEDTQDVDDPGYYFEEEHQQYEQQYYEEDQDNVYVEHEQEDF
jgi:hypothetical protein